MISKIVKLQGKLFAVNLNWYELDKANQVKQISKLLKLNYGVSSNSNVEKLDGFKHKRYIVGLAKKELSSCYALAAVVANNLKSGIFITDKLLLDQNDLSTKLYWVCIFQNKELIAKVTLKDNEKRINISGDELLNESQLRRLIEVYRSQNTVSIFTDLADQYSLNIDSKETSLNDIVSSRISSKFIIRRLHSNQLIYIFLGACVIAAILGLGYYHIKQSQVKIQHVNVIKHEKPKLGSDRLILKDIKANSTSVILNSLIRQLNHTPVIIAGWNIQSIAYSSNDPNNIQIIYKKNPGMSIYDAKTQAQIFIQKNHYQKASISFSNNDTYMQLNIKLDKVTLPLISSFIKDDIANDISMSNAIDTISDIQSDFLNYHLGSIKPAYIKYSKQSINISNINSLVFMELTELANKHRNFITDSIIGKFDNNFNISWSFNGEIYE